MNQIEKFRDEVSKLRRNGAMPKRYPPELRAIALAALGDAQRNGTSIVSVARELGVDHNTLRGWRGPRDKATTPTKKFRAVKVAPEPAVAARFVLRGPAGLSVECSSPDDVAAVFRALA